MPVVFLSHHSENKAKAEAFIQQLEQRPLAKKHGLTVWLDKTHLQQGEQYTDQFSRYIKDEDTCAFILFLPQKTMPGYVEYEIGIALNRYLEAKKAGGKFPLLPLIPLYPGVASDGVMLPQSIDTFQARQFTHNDPAELDAIIGDVLGLAPVPPSAESPPEPITPEPADAESDAMTGWHSFMLSGDETKLTAEDDDGNCVVLPYSELPDRQDETAYLRHLSGWLLNNAGIDTLVASRLRIMTDDDGLALLPWHLLPAPEGNDLLTDSGWIIECGPVQGRGYRHEFTEVRPQSPLLVIPAEHEHQLSGDSHYRIVQSHLEAYLAIRGIIPRARRLAELRHEITAQLSDLIYIYARFDGTHILLDSDGRGADRFTLEELGQWLAEAGAFPVVVLSLLGHELKQYPQALAKNCSLLWVQATSRDKAAEYLQSNLAAMMVGLKQSGDLAELIQRQMAAPVLGMSSHLWLNSNSPRLMVDAKGDQKKQRIRAALLKVMLGRESLKDQMAGGVMTKTLSQKTGLLSYAVTGHADACPHDVPEQVRQRLEWDNIQSNLPVVSYYFHIALTPGQDVYNLLDRAIANSMLCGSDDAEFVLNGELERRGLAGQPCCISLNWFFTLEAAAATQPEQWLEQWGQLVWESFGRIQLDHAVIINAVCLQVADEVDTTATHQLANKALRSLRNRKDCNIQPMIYKHALEELEAGEIEDFLDNDGRFWFTTLNMDQQQPAIDSSAFADWLIEQTDGKFEQTIQTIWREYQQGYRGYLQA